MAEGGREWRCRRGGGRGCTPCEEASTTTEPFTHLSLDLPPPPAEDAARPPLAELALNATSSSQDPAPAISSSSSSLQ